jgi:hypothetical protein
MAVLPKIAKPSSSYTKHKKCRSKNIVMRHYVSVSLWISFGVYDNKPAIIFLNALSAGMVVFEEMLGLWRAELEIHN